MTPLLRPERLRKGKEAAEGYFSIFCYSFSQK
jgi:hypothetical protein